MSNKFTNEMIKEIFSDENFDKEVFAKTFKRLMNINNNVVDLLLNAIIVLLYNIMKNNEDDEKIMEMCPGLLDKNSIKFLRKKDPDGKNWVVYGNKVIETLFREAKERDACSENTSEH